MITREKLRRVERFLGSGAASGFEKEIFQRLKTSFDLLPQFTDQVIDGSLALMNKDVRWRPFFAGVIFGLAAYHKFDQMTPAQFENYICGLETAFRGVKARMDKK